MLMEKTVTPLIAEDGSVRWRGFVDYDGTREKAAYGPKWHGIVVAAVNAHMGVVPPGLRRTVESLHSDAHTNRFTVAWVDEQMRVEFPTPDESDTPLIVGG